MKKDRKELPNKQDEKIENVRKEKEPTLREVKTKKGWNKVQEFSVLLLMKRESRTGKLVSHGSLNSRYFKEY